MPEFFLELFSEEIPARMQRDAAGQLEKICTAALQTLGINAVKTFYGPRRIALSAVLASETSAKTIEERGPRETAPEAALKGFLGKHGASRDDVVVEGGYFVLRRAVESVPATAFVLQELPEALAKFSWPKSMRWGQGGDFTWVRPLRRVVCLLGGEVVPITVGPIIAGHETEGRRIDGGAISVSGVEDWQNKLRGHHVIADQDERRTKILRGIAEAASTIGLTVAEDEGLVEEVTGLVEWPVPLIGKIDEQFMSLPPEVRELSMKVNQRYFALRDADGKPAPYFAFVANLDAPDGGAAIIAGNERVLRARLSDARHFWDIDLKTPLDELLPKLNKITFHTKIGTQGERAKRIAELAKDICKALHASIDEAKQADCAGLLSKADLVTGMVGEFPELQGIIGGYYAETNPNGWDGAVVGPAIKSHYLPKGPSDSVPTGIVAVSVALADKLDTLREFFAIGETPTGSGDPYALRRAALGVIRIILENELRLPLNYVVGKQSNLFAFIIERLRVKLRGEGQRFDILDAVLSVREDDDLVRIMQRVNAMRDFLATDDGANLLVGYRRAANILKIEDAKDGPHRATRGHKDYQSLDADNLERELEHNGAEVSLAINEGDYRRALTQLAKLRAPVDAFFDKVTVNAPEPELRLNRLRLLAQLRDTMHQIADFSKIVG
jgi:glycyl-tRNA synthetase beta chain